MDMYKLNPITHTAVALLFLLHHAVLSVRLVLLAVPHVLADGEEPGVADGGGRLRPGTTTGQEFRASRYHQQ